MDFKIDQKGLIQFKDRLYMPNILETKLFILNEIHKPPFRDHHGYHKMITALKKQFFWLGLKTDVADYLSKWLECQQVKVENHNPVGLLHPLPIPEWKSRCSDDRFNHKVA